MASQSAQRIVILGTGGTIAGTAAAPAEALRYVSAQRSVDELVAAVPGLHGSGLELEQVAQVDSKDMDPALWAALARRCAAHLARPEVAGVVVTHGTDTLEETAWLLHRVLAPAKPLVLTAAMRPATALGADGPLNLLQAVTLARVPAAAGVLVAMAAKAWAGAEVRKVHTVDPNAFCAADAGPVALLGGPTVRALRPWPAAAPAANPMGAEALPRLASDWPWVEIISSHAGADGAVVRALVRSGVRGLVVAATGNGSVHHALHGALQDAVASGVAVLRATRCAFGGIVESADATAARDASTLESAGLLTPAQARVELLLRLLSA